VKSLIDEKTAKKFAAYMKNYPELYEHLTNVLKRSLPENVKKPLIIDLGVGPGLLSKEINKQIPSAEIIGIDPSKEMLELAKENARLKTKIGTADKILLEKNIADVVVTRFSLTYWKDINKGMNEIFRVLKPDGILVIEALNKEFSPWKLILIKMNMLLKFSGINVAKYHIEAYKTAYTIKNVKDILNKLNFKICYFEGKDKDWRFIVVSIKK
jgi:ubiquinone/menaquinone biosynthesis C-methylase UbiE